jgi:uncharacterized protein YigE (DUF2233 family)
MTFWFDLKFDAGRPFSISLRLLKLAQTDRRSQQRNLFRALRSKSAALGLLFVLTSTAYASDPILKIKDKAYAGTELGVVRLNRPSFRLNLYWLKPDGRPYSHLDDLRQALIDQGRVFLMATNSGIYSRDFKPLGLYVENGKTLRPIN